MLQHMLFADLQCWYTVKPEMKIKKWMKKACTYNYQHTIKVLHKWCIILKYTVYFQVSWGGNKALALPVVEAGLEHKKKENTTTPLHGHCIEWAGVLDLTIIFQ